MSQCSVFPSRQTHWRSWTAGTTCKASQDVHRRIISLSDIPATARVAADERESIIKRSSRPIISLPSVILIPLKVGLWHGVGLTLQHSPLAQSHSDVSALWHSGSIYQWAATQSSTVITTRRQHRSGGSRGDENYQSISLMLAGQQILIIKKKKFQWVKFVGKVVIKCFSIIKFLFWIVKVVYYQIHWQIRKWICGKIKAVLTSHQIIFV